MWLSNATQLCGHNCVALLVYNLDVIPNSFMHLRYVSVVYHLLQMLL